MLVSKAKKRNPDNPRFGVLRPKRGRQKAGVKFGVAHKKHSPEGQLPEKRSSGLVRSASRKGLIALCKNALGSRLLIDSSKSIAFSNNTG